MNYVYDNLRGDICEEKFGEKGRTLRYSISHVHTIQWTLNTLNIFRAHMRISLRCLCTRMTKKLLNIAQVCSIFQQMCSEGVPQSMNATLFTIPARCLASSKTFCTLRSVRCRSENCPGNNQRSGLYSAMYFCTIFQARLERRVLRSF